MNKFRLNHGHYYYAKKFNSQDHKDKVHKLCFNTFHAIENLDTKVFWYNKYTLFFYTVYIIRRRYKIWIYFI